MELPRRVVGALALVVVAGGLLPGSPSAAGKGADANVVQGRRVDQAASACVSEGGTGAVRAPRFVRQIATGETGWFSSPGLVDLDGDGRLEIVAPFYSTFVFDAKGRQLGRGTASEGRVYPPVGGQPTSRATASRTSWWPATRAPWRRTSSAAGTLPREARLAGVDEQRRAVARGTRARGRRPRRRRPASRSWRRRPTPRPPAPRCSCSTRMATCSSPRAATRPRGPATTSSRAGQRPAGSTRWATTATARTARTSRSATSTTTATWRSSPPSTTTRSTPSTSTVPRSWPRPGSPTGSPTPRASGWAGASSSGGPTPRSSAVTTTCTPGPGRARTNQTWLQWTASPPAVADLDGDGRNEVIGHPQRRDGTSPTARRRMRSWCSTGRTATGHGPRVVTAASRSSRCPTTRSTGPTATGTRPPASPHRPSSTSSVTTEPEIVAALPLVARSTP